MFVGAPLRLKARAYTSARPSPSAPAPSSVLDGNGAIAAQCSVAPTAARAAACAPSCPHLAHRDAAGSCPCTSLAPPNLSPRPGTREARLVCAPGCLLRAGPGRGFPVHPRGAKLIHCQPTEGVALPARKREAAVRRRGWRWAEPYVAGGPTPGLGGAAWTRARGRARNSASAASVFRCVRFSFLLGGGYGLYLA